MKCVLIRHGKTQGNIEKRYIGCRTDEPLSEAGIAELLEQRKHYPDNRVNSPAWEKGTADDSLLFISPMLRARQTAAILFPGQPQIVIDELKESDFGKFEGKNYQDLNGDPDYQAWIDSGGTISFPEGESPADFQVRSFSGFEKAVKIVLEKFHNPEKERPSKDLMNPEMQNPSKGLAGLDMDPCEIRIVAHGGTVMSVMSQLTGEEYFGFMTGCGEGYTVEFDVIQNGKKFPDITDRSHSSAEMLAGSGADHPLEYVCKGYTTWPGTGKEEAW